MCFFVQVLKNKDHQLHKDIIKDLDSCLDANQLASKCQWFQDRVGPSPMSATLFGNNFRGGYRRNESKPDKKGKPKGAKGKRDSSSESKDEGHRHHAEHLQEKQHDKNTDKRRPKRHGRFKGKKNEDKTKSHANVCQNLDVSGHIAPTSGASIFNSASFQ